MFFDHNLNEEMSIFIEKGIVKLNEIQKNTELKLYAGTVLANFKNTNIDVTSNIGTIKINDVFYDKKHVYSSEKNDANFILKSIKVNIFITHLDTK